MRNRYSFATYSIIHHARTEAEALGVPNGLSTKHLLLALLHDRSSKAVLALESLGATADRIRAAVEVLAGEKDEPPLPVTTDPEPPEALTDLETTFHAKWASVERIPDRAWNEYFADRRALEAEGKHHGRQAVNAAYGFARTLADSDVAEPHHLLLALIREEGGLSSRVFARLNISHTQVVRALKGGKGELAANTAVIAVKAVPTSEDHVPSGKERTENQAIRDHYSHAAKKIVRKAQEAAAALGYPGGLSTKHLLLAILDNGNSKAVRALESLGTNGDRIRAAIEEEAEREDEQPSPVAPDEETQLKLEDLRNSYYAHRDTAPEIRREQMQKYFKERSNLYPHRANPAKDAVQKAYSLARTLGDSDIVHPHHLLLALMRDRTCFAGRVFDSLSISSEQLLLAVKITV